jgi:Predicted hydrolases or acyltransferases (alpha/beta hydrolase superfamily)
VRRFASAGGELTYLDEGEGEVVVLLHGWPTSSFLWRRLTPLLAARFRVLVPDLAGDSIAAQAAGVRELLAHLGVERFAAIGHSYGGGVAQLLALDGAGLDAMLLLDSVAFDVAPPADLDPRTFLERGSVEFASLSATDLAGYLDAAAATPPPQLGDALLGHEAELAAWKFPVMLLWGEDDPFVPMAVAERLNDAIPASTLGVVPESGHFLLDDAFDSIGVLIAEYLRSRYLGAPHGHEGIVMLQLEQRPPWVDLALLEQDDDEPATPDPDDQEVGPNR